MPDTKALIVRTPLFPLYSEVQQLLTTFEGSPRDLVWSVIKTLFDQAGTPQNAVDWSNPDEWIPNRLQGQQQTLAKRIWTESQGTVNPRHIYGSYLFINSFGLLVPDGQGVYRLSPKGEGFRNQDPSIIRELDAAEGLPQLLSILAAHSPAKRGDLLDEWQEFLLENSNYGTPATIKDTLRRRLLNLVDTTIKSIQDIMRKDVGVDGDAQRISQLVWLLFLKIFDDREEELE
jgi:restriction system protein